MKKVIAILACMWLLSGCALAALTAAGAYAYSAGSSKHTERLDKYNQYKLDMEKVNIERAKANLPAQPIMTFDQWERQ